MNSEFKVNPLRFSSNICTFGTTTTHIQLVVLRTTWSSQAWWWTQTAVSYHSVSVLLSVEPPAGGGQRSWRDTNTAGSAGAQREANFTYRDFEAEGRTWGGEKAVAIPPQPPPPPNNGSHTPPPPLPCPPPPPHLLSATLLRGGGS